MHRTMILILPLLAGALHAQDGTTIKRARVFRDAFAKAPKLGELRALARRIGDVKASLASRRGAHILLLVTTGIDVQAPDPDRWMGHLQGPYRKPESPNPGEVRAAILLGSAWLYRQLDEKLILRQKFPHAKVKHGIDPPSVAETAIALIALHRCGVPKNDPLIVQTLITLAATVDTPRYRKARAVHYVGPGRGPDNSLYHDYACLVWAQAELGAELPKDAAKRILKWAAKGDRYRRDQYHAFTALRALRRRGVEFDVRQLRAWERSGRSSMREAGATPDYIWRGWGAGGLLHIIKILHPGTSPAQLRDAPAFAPHVRWAHDRKPPNLGVHHFLIPCAQVRDDLGLRGVLKFYGELTAVLLDRQRSEGDWVYAARGWNEAQHATPRVLIFLAGELAPGTKAEGRK